MARTSHWFLGLEPSSRSVGALKFARWLRRTLGVAVVGVHVHELWMLGLSDSGNAEYLADARQDVERWLAGLGAGAGDGPVDATRIVEAMSAESGLTTVGRGAPGLMIGRRVPGSSAWIRLGRTARRLLRSLPAPVIVVPPELDTTTLRGPVILATDCGESSIAATRFAALFARRSRRPLVCAHIFQPPWFEEDSTPEQRNSEPRRAYRALAERRAHVWAAEHCPEAELVLEQGFPEVRLPVLAETRGASLLVLGSRRLSVVDRMFAASIASTVAAVAPCPVAVVPPDADALL